MNEYEINHGEKYEIRKTDGTDPDFVMMCQRLDDCLEEMVGAKIQRSKYAQYNTLDSIHDVIAIYRDGRIIGSGAYKKYDEDTAEVKRVFVDQTCRGLGIGKMLLHNLEKDMIKNGYQYAILETGELLVAASGLYRSMGYQVIPNYGQYKDMKESLCMKKKLVSNRTDRDVVIETERLVIYPFSDNEMRKLMEQEADEGMRQAYSEMLQGCVENPEHRIWNAVWNMELKSDKSVSVGDLSFKGLGTDGMVEIGYGIRKKYEGQGYMTEAVTAMAKWASEQTGVKSVEAETEADNLASQRVLEKAGFKPNGVMGAEGPRFVYK